jgi:hypothetical protein
MNGVDPADYDVWKSHYGDMAPGSGGGNAAVPEPSTGLLFSLAVGLFFVRHRNRIEYARCTPCVADVA